jgi:DNA-binding NarL/FixJ family response regulator
VYLFCGSCAFIRCEDTAVVKEERTRVKQALLIEDHALFREGLALLLRWRTGLESVEAGSLEEGHRVLRDLRSTADVAIINLNLPDGDGSELIEQLHKTKPDVPVVALTADRSLTWQARALEAGADEVLAKATPAEQIIAAVERIRRR